LGTLDFLPAGHGRSLAGPSLDGRLLSCSVAGPQRALADLPGHELGTAGVLAGLGQVDPGAERQGTLAALGEPLLLGVTAAWQDAELGV
jgi:hypothetical protein